MADESNVEIQPELSPSTKRRRRNQQYYEKNKDSLKAIKESYTFKLEVTKEDAHRLAEIKAKMDIVKERLRELHAKTTNVDLMEALVDSWLDANQTGQYVDPLASANEPVNFLNLIDDHSLESTSVSPSLYVNPKVQLHSVCKENDEIYLVCGTALERLFRYFIESGNVCGCGTKFNVSSIKIGGVTPHSHCVKVVIGCVKKHVTEWFSSSMIALSSAIIDKNFKQLLK